MSAKNSKPPLTIFTLTSGRSGTLYLRDLFRHNIRDCVCRHEPFFDWGNPTLFGPAIYDAFAGRIDRIRQRLARKRDYILRRGGSAYLESSHAFLKSAYVAALEFFPDMRLIHLIRNPLLVANSEAVREERRAHAPFHYYTGDDGRRHFCWALTTNEEIYRYFDRDRLSLFQRYLVQWIEIENRAMAFLQRHGLHGRCFTLECPRGLNDARTVKNMFDFMGLPTRRPEIVLAGGRNASLGYAAAVRPDNEREFAEILAQLPDHYLEIFHREPYTPFEWSARFRAGGKASQPVLENAV